MEIITGVERRRRWRLEDKLRMLAELDEPGMSVAAVARRHEISRGLLHHWRRQFRKGALTELAQQQFVPLEIVQGAAWKPSLTPSAKAGRTPKRAGMIEIELGGGRRVRVDRDVDGDAPGDRSAGAAVIPVPTGVHVWLAVGYTDMRRGMNGLALQVQETLRRDPHAGDLYVFRGKRGNLIKILWHDGLGMSLYAKRLEHGRFIWPSPADGSVAITAAQLGYMLEGIDWRHPQRTWRPALAG